MVRSGPVRSGLPLPVSRSDDEIQRFIDGMAYHRPAMGINAKLLISGG